MTTSQAIEAVENTPKVNIESVSVKIMRSFDYSHFEVTLGATIIATSREDELKLVDDLRKAAARLADKAVRQYQIAKENCQLRDADESTRERLMQETKEAIEKLPGLRSPREKALVKWAQDKKFEARRQQYDYEDDFEDDYDGNDVDDLDDVQL